MMFWVNRKASMIHNNITSNLGQTFLVSMWIRRWLTVLSVRWFYRSVFLWTVFVFGMCMDLIMYNMLNKVFIWQFSPLLFSTCLWKFVKLTERRHHRSELLFCTFWRVLRLTASLGFTTEGSRFDLLFVCFLIILRICSQSLTDKHQCVCLCLSKIQNF